MADQLPLTSSRSSDVTVEGQSRPSKTTIPNFGHHQDLAALDNIELTPPFPRQHTDSFKTGRLQNRIASWYLRNDGPWTPAGLGSSQTNLRAQLILGNLRGNSLPYFQENIVPSECDTVPTGAIPSDSGYGGSYGAKHSVGNGSVCDESLDRNPETQSLIGHIDYLKFHSFGPDLVSKSGVALGTPWPQSVAPPSSSSSVIDHQINFDGGHMCELCDKILKTKSELKKHRQRHEKPFKCDVKDCTRREGFSTPNDLSRHKRSLHPREYAAGSRFICPFGACKSKDKIWPRADNFRAHMKRVHLEEITADDDLEKYKFDPIHPSKENSDPTPESTTAEFGQFNALLTNNTSCASESWPLPRSPVIDLSSKPSPIEGPSQVGARSTCQLVDKSHDLRHLYLPNDAATHETRPHSGSLLPDKQTSPTRPTPEEIGLVGSQHLHDIDVGLLSQKSSATIGNGMELSNYDKHDRLSEPRDHPGVSLLENQPNRHLEGLAEPSEKDFAPPQPRGLDIEGFSPMTVDLRNRDTIQHLLETLHGQGVLQEFGYKKEALPEPENTKKDSVASNASEQTHTCSECPKRFNRLCELRKHQKRHSKPYACTFLGCAKKFGSKNDWKRHENSQHLLSELWRCDQKQADTASEDCAKFFPRRELFKQHLAICHDIKDQAVIDDKLEICRVGRNYEVRFWCGFCQKIIEIKKEGSHAVTERFNHIDDHFHGRNDQAQKEITDWKNEYPLCIEAESLNNDSEDSCATSVTLAPSVTSSNIHDHVGLTKQHAKAKRKRDDRSDEFTPKRVETIVEMPRSHCVSDSFPC
ncbi:uncharacterized protein GGS25DRAFT_533219 [Hypoxylon fragiforme]|uniref:uncharacterized protein n=1 Tax=Hypoxylon fragiforme TaxID=63214 RepID=UPI0020C7116A|nr:uncharacterized protein GGS25DRAFT_533219 [Hypoxylon fragiforme]KAI2606056.1 hypothetical protein GGS25DRAFT_533219 [Hypoxylon fragiforme]